MKYLKIFEEFTPNNPECNVKPPEVTPHTAETTQQEHDKKKEEQKEKEKREQEAIEILASSTTTTRNLPNS